LPNFRLGRHRAALGLLTAGSLVLIGAQIALSGAADAQTTQAAVDVHDLQALGVSNTAAAPQFVTAAVETGQFEELVKPSPVPPTSVPPTPAPTVVPTVAPTPAPAVTLYESGIASTYGEGDGFEGNLTACGQVFHTSVVQIAHKSLPCGTVVRVEDTDTGRSVEARVTDRGPYVPGRIVDLSWGAFQQLDPTGPGLLHVNVYLLNQ
jgi:peptidoglycan lytic transglycosylase